MYKNLSKILIIAILAISFIGNIGYRAVADKTDGGVKETSTIVDQLSKASDDEAETAETTQTANNEATETTRPHNNENAKANQTTVKQSTVVKGKNTNTSATTNAQNSKPNKPQSKNTYVEQTTKATQASILTLEPMPESYEPTEFERLFFDKINYERTSRGLKPFIWNDNLHALTGIRANEIVSKWSHERPNGKMPISLLDERNVSYTKFGENIAAGTPMEEQYIDSLVEALMKSEGHRANILNPDYKYSAIGAKTDANGIVYVAQLFYT